MYNFHEFGKRLQHLRKQSGFTQEEVATRLSVSPQAVSKWENDACYPDIATLPALASIFNTGIETLFGVSSVVSPDAVSNYPETYAGLPFVHAYGEVGVYASKDVSCIQHDAIAFTDGSTFTLHDRTIVNKGAGEIRLLYREYIPSCANGSQQTDASFTFDKPIKHVRVVVNNNSEYTITKDKSPKTTVAAQGDAGLLTLFKAYMDGDTLVCEEQSRNNCNSSNPLSVALHMAEGDYNCFDFNINGSGTVTNEINVENLHVQINGSGTVTHPDTNARTSVHINGSGDVSLGFCHQKTELKINGAGDIKCGIIDGESHIGINGAGDVSIGSITGHLESKINGAGDMSIQSGELSHCGITIRGSGDIDARGVVTQTAYMDLSSGSGQVTLGHVVVESVEKTGKKSKITVLKRGR